MRIKGNYFILLLFGNVFMSIASPPTITGTPTAKLRNDVNSDSTSVFIDVTDPESDTFTCQTDHIAQSWPFNVNVHTYPDGCLLMISHADPAALTSSLYVINVQCTDVNNESSNDDVTVTISSNSPPVPATSLIETVTVDVSATFLPQTVLHTVAVTDPDGDPVTCTATPPSADFSVDANDCTIRNVRDLRSLPLTSSQVLEISVSDGVNTAVVFQRTLSFTKMNTPPAFADHQPVVPVDEHVTALTSLFQFDITDASPLTVRFEVDPVSETSYFAFDDATYEIKLASGQSFDYETKPTQFLITCTADDGFQQSSSSVTISITDSNDAPYFQASTVVATVDEGPGGTVTFLPSYEAADPDSDSLTYEIVSGGTYSDHFSISTDNGELTSLLELDRDGDAPNPISIEVKVTDPDGLSATTNVTIFLNDVNDNKPKFDQASYEFKVGLSTQMGTLLGTLGVSDKDDGNNSLVTLEVTDEHPAGYLTLEQTGHLLVTGDLGEVDYGTVFSLEVTATDGGQPPLSSTAVVNVVWLDGPRIQGLTTVYVKEKLIGWQPIFDLDVVDAESNQYTCFDKAITPNTDLFAVERATGSNMYQVVFTGTGSLSSDAGPYAMTVVCEDSEGRVTEELTISVRGNTPPVPDPGLCPGSVTVDARSTDTVDTVFTVQASDGENDPLEFTLTFSSSVFSVGKYSGEIKPKTSLREVTTDQFSLSVTITDGEDSSECVVRIFLTNVNQEPFFANLDYTVDVPENTAAGSNVFTITVTDPNIFGPNILLTSDGPQIFKFDVVVSGLTAAVKVADGVELDYENSRERTMTLTFVASDGYLTSDEGTLTIELTPENEPPYFVQNILNYYVTFQEFSQPPEEAVLGCEILDPDEDDEVTLTLSGTNANLFTIEDLNNCQMTLISEYDLDGGAPDEVTLTLTATDKQGMSAEASVTVTIQAINDNTPEFAEAQRLTAYFGMQSGEVIGTVVATDLDIGPDGVLSYEVEREPLNPQTAEEYLIFSNTGEFILRQPMDSFGSSESFHYVISVTDGGQPARSATTTVDVVYVPTTTTTPQYNLTTSTETTEAAADQEGDSSLLEEPLVIGLLVALACVLGILAIVGAYLCWRTGLCSSPQPRSASTNSLYNSRSPRASSPVRTNKISVSTVENGYNPSSLHTAYHGRKISGLV